MAKTNFINQLMTDIAGLVAGNQKKVYATFVVATSIIAFYTLPPIAATISAGFITLAAYGIYERRRRLFWEQSMSFKLLKLDQGHERLVDSLSRGPLVEGTRNRRDVSEDAIEDGKTLRARKSRDIFIDEGVVTHKNSLIREETTKIRRSIKEAKKLKASLSTIETRVLPHHANDETANNVFISDSLVHETVVNSVKNGTFMVKENPMMRLPKRQAFAYYLQPETSAFSGEKINSDIFMDKVEKANLSAHVAMQMIEHASQNHDKSYIIDANMAFFMDSKFMGSFVQAIKNTPNAAKKITLRFTHSDFESAGARALQVMRSMAKLGCQFALHGASSVEAFDADYQTYNIRSLFVDSLALGRTIDDAATFRKTIQNRRNLETHGIRVVLDGMNSETLLKRFTTLAPRYALGSLFKPSETAKPLHKAA